jgi:hypothetical protein
MTLKRLEKVAESVRKMKAPTVKIDVDCHLVKVDGI